ncbi:MAG: hypothetical protein JWN24_2823 [Phycisphaerales bacterium]|nr:hypothetical protein [Phycisphaerales bacterium]
MELTAGETSIAPEWADEAGLVVGPWQPAATTINAAKPKAKIVRITRSIDREKLLVGPSLARTSIPVIGRSGQSALEKYH